jgi:tripartite-type tricarboxylate transporter receptor subunit TctC
VPYAAGGGVDILARTLGDVVSKEWGQPVVVENRPGAGGVVASQALVSSAPDGYTLIVVASGHATNPFLYPKIPYDTFKDFTPSSLLASSPNILLVRADSPFKTLGDVIAQAKAKPGSLSFAHAGTGTSTHLAGELLKNLANIDIAAIPYKGGAPAINDLLGGQIPLSFNNGPESVGQIAAGTVRALAVTTAARAPFLPDVPSIGETVPGYDTEVWWGLLGPGGMPRELIEKLSHDFVAAVNTEAVKERLNKLGATPIGSSPEAFNAKIHADYEKWGPIIKAASIRAE